MPALFTKPIEELTDADVAEIIGWPESLTVEFKGELPGKDGRPDPWLKGGSVDAFARDKLFKEVIALANTSGGHLVLGIKETSGGTPPTAAEVTPVPRCADLAERLSRAAQQIDPPIPLLLVRGVETDGGAGVVVFRVPASRSAPHRGLDKECYVRRGASSVPVGMREIQDMTLAVGRRERRVDARFIQAATRFAEWLPTQISGAHNAVGFRITAVPVGITFDLGRLYGRTDLVPSQQNYKLTGQGQEYQAHVARLQSQVRPIVRGVRRTYDEDGIPTYLELYSDGVVDLGYRTGPQSQGKMALAIGWIVAYLIHIVRIADALRKAAEAPDAEYALEIELRADPSHDLVNLVTWKPTHFNAMIGSGLRLPITLPRISFGSSAELDQVVSIVVTDLYDAVGGYLAEPMDLHVEV